MNNHESNGVTKEVKESVLENYSNSDVRRINEQESNVVIEKNEETVLTGNPDFGIIQHVEGKEDSSFEKENLTCEGNENLQESKNSIIHGINDDLKVMLLEEENMIDGLYVNYFFPALRDPGLNISFLEYVFTAAPSKEKSERRTKVKYMEVCKYLEIAPITSFHENLSSDAVDLGFYGVSSKAVQAISAELHSNSYIRLLNLEDNHLKYEAVYHLREMLCVNVTVSELNLKGCKIGEKGAEILSFGLQANTSLKLLNLANNDIEDNGMKFLAKAFLEHFALKKINLSGNNLFKKSAVRLGRMLEENCILEELDLSWNRLNSKEGCKKLLAGLKINSSLEYFYISWNGLNHEAAAPLAECLSKNNILQHLDISNNNFNDDDAIVIGDGLKNNSSLKQLKVFMNCFTHNGAMSLLTALLKPTLKIEILDFQNLMVEKEFKELLTEVHKVCRAQVFFGGYKSDYEVKGPDVKELLLKRANFLAKKPKKRPKDFGQFLLKLEDKSLKGEEFKIKLNEAKIKLDTDLVDELLEAFKVNKLLNIKGMKEHYLRLFPDTKLVTKEKKIRNKSKKGKKKSKSGTKSRKNKGKK